MFIQRLSEEWRKILPFKNDRPGVRFLRACERRRYAQLKFAVPRMYEGKHWATVNAETLTEHFAKLEVLMD